MVFYLETLSAFIFSLHTVKLNRMNLNMASTTSYIAVELSPKKKTVLLQRGNKELIDTVTSWNKNKVVDEEKLSRWMNEGLCFPLDNSGTAQLFQTETQKNIKAVKKPSSLKYSTDLFVNIADKSSNELKLVSASKVNSVQDIRTLQRNGDAFSNISMLFADRAALARVNNIATRIKDFSPDSRQWKLWMNHTNTYNATSLTQVFQYYFNQHSAGDVGGKEVNYIPKRGYPGTLGPGELFRDNLPITDLPNKILHPWPAMQEHQFHVRWPVSHPMIAPPLLWFALNNMYTQNYTDWMNDTPREELLGGMSMEAIDAIRIARLCTLGMSYDPAVQQPHGGSIVNGAHKMSHYNPDHGPTVPLDEADPPMSESLRAFVERWLPPTYGMDLKVAELPEVYSEDLAEELDEEELRREANEKLIAALTGEPDAVAPEVPGELPRELQEVVAGRTRSRARVIHYSIQTVRDMQDELVRLERDLAARKKSSKKKSRKQDLDFDGPLPFDTSPTFDLSSGGEFSSEGGASDLD